LVIGRDCTGYDPDVKRRTVPIAGPIDLKRTLTALNGGRGHPEERMTASRAWRASRNPEGPVTLKLTVRGDRVVAQAWGAGAEWELEHLPDLLGTSQNPADFPTPHRVMRDLHRKMAGFRISRTNRVYEALVPIILGQVVATREAHRAERRLDRAYGEPAPGPHSLVLQPAPETLAQLEYEDLHPLGIARNKANLIIEVSRRAKRLERLTGLESHEAADKLRSIKGIGPWTTALVVAESHGDQDAVHIGDYHLPSTVSWALAGEPRADDSRMLELLEPYRPYRRRAVMLLKMGGVGAPKYGPKRAVRSFERF
jgi:3-methyladenine DNA glycosylase/8-oxoguanine DNA glycosylase